MRLFSFIFFFICAYGNAQEKIDVSYGVLFNDHPYSQDFITQYPDVFDKFLQEKERAKELIFILSINKNKALFTHPPVDENDQNLYFAYQNTDGEHIFYTDLKEEKQIVQFPYWGAEINIENQINEIPWILTTESKEIGNYVCFKATKKFEVDIGGLPYTSNVEAWYAPEIPIKFGPKQYVGLPRLIVELQENHITYFLKGINYQPKDPQAVLPPKKGVKMSWEEFAEKSIAIKKTAKQAIRDGRR